MSDTNEYRWPCTQCGAQLRYAPGQTELICDHCGHRQTIDTGDSARQSSALQELDLAQGLRDDLPGAVMTDVRTATCTNCGAQVEFDGTLHAAECPFCASPIVLDSSAHQMIKAQALVPFVLNEGQARKAMIAWMGRLWFAPSTLLQYARKGRAMNGIYVPFWTFDAATRSRYIGQRGDYYYETRTVTVQVNGKPQQRQEQVRKTRWSSASGRVARDFDDILVIGSTSLPQHLGDALSPWDLTALQSYAPEFLAGFQAEGYTVPLADADHTAKDRMARVIDSDARRDIGGDEQRITSIDTDYSNETFKHILLPVWMAAYKYNGKSYRFVVNGQTGEVQGERPWSIWKIGFAVAVVVSVVLGAIYLTDPSTLGLPTPGWMD